ncbi:Prefoldin subunit-domain-containing protein [Nemania sp. FL0916]|nr:Prefoldin subunit-domain-containing protein [Nemania sp. FL0916]
MPQAQNPQPDPEEHLRQLEEKVDKLVIALDEWRQWKQEYESLRREVEGLSPIATRSARTQTRQGFKGELVDEKELVGIFGRDDSRTRDQVISTVSNRLDYVSKNIITLANQLDAAENALASSREAGDTEFAEEDGLPITEISEELDDDDNVISYKLRRPGESQPQLIEALEKAGDEELPLGPQDSVPGIKFDALKPSYDVASTSGSGVLRPRINEAAAASNTKGAPKKKSVTFSEDTKEATEVRPSNTVQKVEELYRQAKEQENIISDPILPVDESPEDAELREDMLRYNRETMLWEMAPIVAELSLEEGLATDDDDWNDDSEGDDDDDEDQWGRSTSGVIDDEYKREMLELKERLSRQTFGEQGTASDEDDEFAEGIGKITIKDENVSSTKDQSHPNAANENAATESTSKDETKKSVRFAPSLDIAEPSPPAPQPEPVEQPEATPLSDVMERRSTTANKTPSASTRKPSRFRRDRINDAATMQTPPIAPEKPHETTRYAPSGPEGQILAASVLEHEPSDKVREPDELDANLLHQQVTEEYYRMRNKMIGRKGGFLKENTNPIQPLGEEEGGPKRVSRFKAARLAQA